MKKLIIAATMSLSVLSASAFAGNWGSPVTIDHFRAAGTMNLAQMAGTSNTSQVSGSCTTGALRDFYLRSGWTCTLSMCNGFVTVYRQTCI
jgi:hypothetical protein